MNIRNTLATLTLILFLTISCKDEIIFTDAHLAANTDKSVYNSSQLITVNVKNFTNKTVYINQCGESLHQTLIKIDSSSSGGGSFTMVCRQLTNYELRTGKEVSDTLSFLLPGRYKLKYLYDYEDIAPELSREELYSNEFDIQ
ncbi:MAG TPA: hypothetical protein VK870_07265 [Ignavibacteriaceae bacterium]|nr:hypothetical protein [Ignavibacteriaceae bacterium]